MIKLLSISNVGSLHSRKRVAKRRFGLGKGDMSYHLHVGKTSLYFYPANIVRPLKGFRKPDAFAL